MTQSFVCCLVLKCRPVLNYPCKDSSLLWASVTWGKIFFFTVQRYYGFLPSCGPSPEIDFFVTIIPMLAIHKIWIQVGFRRAQLSNNHSVTWGGVTQLAKGTDLPWHGYPPIPVPRWWRECVFASEMGWFRWSHVGCGLDKPRRTSFNVPLWWLDYRQPQNKKWFCCLI